jgi:short-subunit dehydrogenase
VALPAPSSGTTVVVTGASSGIGFELSRELAQRGYGLTIVARRRDRLEELAAALTHAHGVDIAVEQADLSEATERVAFAESVLEAGRPAVVGLCNNAGFATTGKFHELPLDRELDEVALNVVAAHHMVGLFLPGMVKRGEGAILNTSSVASFQPIPELATYAATKAFVRSFSEAIHSELSGTGVSVTALCPGPTRTEFNAVAGIEDEGQAIHLPGLHSEAVDVAKAGVDAMVKGDRGALPGIGAKAMAAASQYMPNSILLPLTKAVGIDRVLR